MKRLTKYLKKRKTAIDFILEKPSNKYTTNTFHKLRVEIKKLNSFFDLVNFCSNNFKRKASNKPFKSIFRQAGKVRELQIEDAIIKKYLANNCIRDYRKSLRKLQLIAKEDFFLLVNKKMMNLLNKKYLAVIPHLFRIDQKKINAYLEKKKKDIKKLVVKENIQIEQIHKLRKQLKNISYNKAISDNKKSKEQLVEQNIMLDLLGKWHDCQVIIEHLEQTLKRGQLNLTEVDQIKTIKLKVSFERNILFEEINKALPQTELFAKNN